MGHQGVFNGDNDASNVQAALTPTKATEQGSTVNTIHATLTAAYSAGAWFVVDWSQALPP